MQLTHSYGVGRTAVAAAARHLTLAAQAAAIPAPPTAAAAPRRRCFTCRSAASPLPPSSGPASRRLRIAPSPPPRTSLVAHRSLSTTSIVRSSSSAPTKSTKSLTVLSQTYPSDDYTNLPGSIISRLAPSPTLPYTPHHPLCLLRTQIERQIGSAYTPIRAPSPIVSTQLNFEELGFPADHPGRSPTDTYYLNRTMCLRTHTSAHEVETFRQRHTRWLLTADVYRRDEIDASHYPIFHQMEGAAIFPPEAYAPGGQVESECEAMEAKLAQANLEIEDTVDLHEAGGFQAGHDEHAARLACRHLKATLNGLVLNLFGQRQAQESLQSSNKGTGTETASAAAADPLRVRWIAATFPFTSPSFEVEVWFRGKWLEILGCGVVMENTLLKSGVNSPDTPAAERQMGWAFGLGLERVAMVLYSIPDIRLFWSQDRRFFDQFVPPVGESRRGGGVSPAGGATSPSNLVTFKPYSKYPPCYKDVSFWVPSAATGEGETATTTTFHENDFYEIVRDTVADLAEDVVRIDEFVHPKTGRQSLCYRINYRSMDRSLENEEVNALHAKVLERLVDVMRLEIR